MSSQKNIKNGGFPPIKYCSDNKENTTSKERFFANAPRQNINIRQLLSDTNKKLIIIPDNSVDNELQVVNNL